MEKAVILLFAAVFTLAGCGVLGSDSIKVGVVDIAKVVNESREGKQANAELESFLKARQAIVGEKTTAVEHAKKELEKADAASKKTKEADLNRLAMEHQNLVNTSQAEIQRKASELKNSVIKEIRQVVDGIAVDEKLTMVLTSESAFYYQKTIDITDKVIQKYDESWKAK